MLEKSLLHQIEMEEKEEENIFETVELTDIYHSYFISYIWINSQNGSY